MKEQLEHRLVQLKAEFEAGQKMLADLQSRQADIERTLLRISGAIQVLEEELEKVPGSLPVTEMVGVQDGRAAD